jgi:single-stranded-DNA-specific exonuclease
VERRWILREADPGRVEALSQGLGISIPVARVLVNRGVEDIREAQRFLSSTLRDLHPPESLADMDQATQRILAAMEAREPVWIYGDYDADGITSVALMLSFLRGVGVKANPVIPNRERDGYGFQLPLILRHAQQTPALVITVDCGVSDGEEIAKAKECGIDVIVTDHHEVPPVLPKACAVINPKRGDNRYPFPDLAGVGVAFLVIWALARSLKERGFWKGNEEPSLKEYLDLVALGTVADQAPLLGENRVLVRYGLRRLSEHPRLGVSALLGVCGSNGRVPTVGTLSFQVAPRLNAPGRVGDAQPALDLLMATDAVQAEELAVLLDGMNRQRQQIEEQVYRETGELARGEVQQGRRAIVLAQEGWHPGVLGIVASRLVDRFGLPTVLVSIQDGVAKGSARSPEGFHLMKGLTACAAHLSRFGGHRHAAGLRMDAGAVAVFREALCQQAQAVLGDRAPGPVLRIDDRLAPQDVSEELVRELARLEPHGIGNPEPVFQMEGLEIAQSRRVGQDHLKLSLRAEGLSFDAIGFNMATSHQAPPQGRARLACIPQINEWQGRTSIQLKLKDLVLLRRSE